MMLDFEHFAMCGGILAWGVVTYFLGWWAGAPLYLAAGVGFLTAGRKVLRHATGNEPAK
jgi:hypothetical protein